MSVEAIKKAENLEGFAREALQKHIEENNLQVCDSLSFMIEAIKENCQFNFFGCNDSVGEHLAFDIKEIESAFGLERPTCKEICDHGCCAYINHILFSIGKKVYESEEDEA